MIKLYSFECKKIFKNKITWVAVILSIIAVIGLYYLNYTVAENVRQGNITLAKNNLIAFQNMKEELELELERKKAEENGNSENVQALEAYLKQMPEGIIKRERFIQNYEQGNWQEIHKNNLAHFSGHLNPEFNMDLLSYYIDEQNISPFTIRANLEEKEWMLAKDIEPFSQVTHYFGSAYLPTIHDQFTGKVSERWESETNRYGTQGLYFIYQMIQALYIPIVILIGCFIFGNNISTENSKKKKGLYFYFVQPINRGKFFAVKYLSGLTSILGFVLLLVLVPFLCGFFIDGLGSLQYPVFVYEGSKPSSLGPMYNRLNPLEDPFHFIDLIDYLGQAFVLTVVLTIFLYSFYYTLILLVKNPSVTMIIVTLVTYVGISLTPTRFNPFTYVDIHKVLNGETATLAFNPSITFQNGIITLIFFTCLLSAIGYLVYNKVIIGNRGTLFTLKNKKSVVSVKQ